jgi:hypothetical protein
VAERRTLVPRPGRANHITIALDAIPPAPVQLVTGARPALR